MKPENKNNLIQKDVKTNIPNPIKTAKKETVLTEYQSKLQISNPYNHINTENQSDVNIPNYVDASDQRDNFISDDDNNRKHSKYPDRTISEYLTNLPQVKLDHEGVVTSSKHMLDFDTNR